MTFIIRSMEMSIKEYVDMVGIVFHYLRVEVSYARANIISMKDQFI